MKSLSIRQKAAVGYLLLIVLLVAAVYFINHALSELTGSGEAEAQLNRRQRMTNSVVSRLYSAEIIGQAVSAGQTDAFPDYVEAMMQAAVAVDSLRPLMADRMQLARLDSVCALLEEKADNMRLLVEAIEADNSEALYRRYIDDLIAGQSGAMEVPSVQRREVVRTDSFVVHRKRKNFFGRLRDAFTGGKTDSARVSSMVKEEITDTLVSVYNPADTVARMLAGVRSRVSDSRFHQARALSRRAQKLRQSGLELSVKVGQLLNAIVDEGAKASAQKRAQEEVIRYTSALTIAGIALVAVVLALVFVVVIWRDITRSNRYRRELEEAKKKAEDLLDVREKLMLTITHDIKAPVGSIIGYADLLERITKEERQRFYLGNMHSSAEHLLRLVNSLLDFHRLDANKMDVRVVAFNPRQLLDTIFVSFKPMASKKGLSVGYDCDRRLDKMFESDPFRIRQIVENLMSNALKFTQKGSISLSAEMDGESRMHVCVADTGCGIAPQEQERIFQEFTRLRDAQGQEGFGLGLAITQKLIALLGGSIKVESERGKGSCFHVYLPMAEVDGESEELAAGEEDSSIQEKETAGEAEKPLRLLLIDDDRLQMQLTVAMLHAAGIETVCCEQPEELFVKIGEEHFDAVLTDIQMPAMNGFDLLKAIRGLPSPEAKAIPVVAITARSDMDVATLREEGFAGCVHKPFNQAEMVSVIRRAVEEGVRNRDYDFSALTAFSGDDEAAAREIMRTFAEETRKNVRRMRAAVGRSDMREVAEAAHKMLPLFSMIGASESVKPLTRLERKRGVEAFSDADRDDAETVIEEADRILARLEEENA